MLLQARRTPKISVSCAASRRGACASLLLLYLRICVMLDMRRPQIREGGQLQAEQSKKNIIKEKAEGPN